MAAGGELAGIDRVSQASSCSRRRLLMAASGGAVLALAAACGAAGQTGSGTQESSARPGTSTQPVKLLWQIREGPSYEELAKWGASEFKKKYPNATIDFMTEGGNLDKTLARMVAGDGPDVIHSFGYLMWQYAAKGLTYNHNDLIKDLKKADTDDFVDYQWKGLIIPNTNFRYGMPTYVNMFVLYYNKSLLLKRGQKEPTVDWDHNEYANALKQLTFLDGDKKVWGGFMNAPLFDRQYHAWAFGGNYVDPKDNTKSAFDQPATQQALEWKRARLHQDQTWAPVDANKRTWQPNSQFDGFFQGAVATLEDGMHAFQRVATGMASTGADWNIAHMPRGPVKRATLGTTDSWALWKGTRSKDTAWELIKFLTSKEWYDQQSKMEGLIPSRKSSLDTWVTTMKEKFPAAQSVDYKVVTDALTTMNYLSVDQIYLCQSEAAQIVGPALNAVLRDGEKPATHLKDIKQQIDQAAGSCGIKFT